MTTQIEPANDALSNLMRRARSEGEPDVFHGKRGWIRYNIGLKLDARADGVADKDVWPVITHNISGGGIGFWSKRQVSAGNRIWIREAGIPDERAWIPALVTHCSLSISGYLVGVAFDQPVNSEPSGSSFDSVESAPQVETRQRESRLSLVSQTALILTLSVTCGTGVGFAFALLAVQNGGHWILGPALGMGVAAVCSWFGYGRLAHAQEKFAADLCQEFQRISDGDDAKAELPDAPTRELETLRKAFAEIRTHMKQREEIERARRQKLEEVNLVKSNILNMVSHDLRTPLTSILMYTEMLREDLASLEENDRQRFLKIIADECGRLSRLVDDLLEAQRLESGRTQWRMKRVDASELVRNCATVFDVMARSKTITLGIECPATLPFILADADKISQVISNLVSNALKYTQAGGAVRLKAEAQGNQLLITVADNGPGIPRDQWDQIFDRFAQYSAASNVREIPGVGLGLYIVRQIVEQHSGRVWVDSEVGRGSEFYVSLPLDAPVAAARESAETRASVGRVLVCDPDPDMTARIVQALRGANYTVRHAHSGCRLLSLAESADFDVILTDILLPDMHATDFLDALAQARTAKCGLVIHSYAGEAIELRRWGADVFLQRPATADEILQAVRVARQHSAGDGRRTILIVAPAPSCEGLKREVTVLGHLPMCAETLVEAAELMRDYPVDFTLIDETALEHDWSDLAALPSRGDGAGALIVCGEIGRKTRKLAEQRHVAVAARGGAVADAIAASLSSCRSRVESEAGR